ncbi:MAG: T9SS type A sorting domain-containing protein [Bacteroidetes bacterium]|jgi:hypothetical protein|nr:T9SS type A sorting domain-containing protein [Bacteroidota bacterium]
MKLNLFFLLALMLSSTLAISNPVTDSTTMGGGYASDVFYSFENGVIATSERNTWDIAFYTNRWSAGIITNGGIGTQLVTYENGDTSNWNAIDTTGMAGWKRLYNSDSIWEDGAFNRNAMGHPDYGWGMYNMVSHDVVGDSIYIITLANGAKKKLWIESKNSVNNTYTFTYANLDGTNEYTEVLDATPYEDKLFVYYNLSISSIIDREPLKNSWDIIFTRYVTTVFDNEGNPSPYTVVGVLNNVGVAANKNYPVDESFTDWTAQPMDDAKTVIGHNWKYFDMNSFSYVIEDSTVFFVQALSGNVYKFVPTYFSGQSEGKTIFTKELISLVSVDENSTIDNSIAVFPNPAKDHVRVALNNQISAMAELQLFDLSGRIVYQTQQPVANGMLDIRFDNLLSGLYLIRIQAEGQTFMDKLMIR